MLLILFSSRSVVIILWASQSSVYRNLALEEVYSDPIKSWLYRENRFLLLFSSVFHERAQFLISLFCFLLWINNSFHGFFQPFALYRNSLLFKQRFLLKYQEKFIFFSKDCFCVSIVRCSFCRIYILKNYNERKEPK